MGWEKQRGMREPRTPFLDGGTIMGHLGADSRSEGKAGDEGKGDGISLFHSGIFESSRG
jgi:hypothetical protein